MNYRTNLFKVLKEYGIEAGKYFKIIVTNEVYFMNSCFDFFQVDIPSYDKHFVSEEGNKNIIYNVLMGSYKVEKHIVREYNDGEKTILNLLYTNNFQHIARYNNCLYAYYKFLEKSMFLNPTYYERVLRIPNQYFSWIKEAEMQKIERNDGEYRLIEMGIYKEENENG